MKIPAALMSGHLCVACKGTGADIDRTKARPAWEQGYVICNPCNGNGLGPAEYFRWGNHAS
jgi:DnaJ-class molecular chaperone